MSHEAKLNVEGAPFVRPMEPLKVVAGKSMTITCPVAGFPISGVAWEKGRFSQTHAAFKAYELPPIGIALIL